MDKSKLPVLPNGEKWNDYIELEYAAENPCRGEGTGGMAGSDVLKFFMRMESGKVLIVDGTEYIRRAAWWERLPKVRTLMATLAGVARGAGHSRRGARSLVKAWATSQRFAGEWGVVVRSERYDEHIFMPILRSFLDFINEAARAERP